MWKTKLLFKLLLENYFDFDRIVFVSPSLDQIEYDVIIKSLQKTLNINQIIIIFEQQNHIKDINNALDIISNNVKFKPSNLEVTVYKKPDDILLPQELNSKGHKRILVIIDDCTILNSVKPTHLFVYGRPLNINTIYLSQKYTKVPFSIRENCNVFVFFEQNTRTLKDFIFREVGDQFEKDTEIESFFKMIIKTKHDFILYNKDEGKWYDKTLSLITLNINGLMSCEQEDRILSDESDIKDLSLLNSLNLKSINSGMGYKLYPNEKSYTAAKANAYKEEQENRKIINDREHFHAALLKSTSEVFKPITKNQDKSFEQEQNIVKEITDLSKSLKVIKEEPIKKELVDQKEEQEEQDEQEEQEQEQEQEQEESNETLSKNECIDLINSDDNIDELFGIKIYNDGVIRCRIYTDFKNHHLI